MTSAFEGGGVTKKADELKESSMILYVTREKINMYIQKCCVRHL